MINLLARRVGRALRRKTRVLLFRVSSDVEYLGKGVTVYNVRSSGRNVIGDFAEVINTDLGYAARIGRGSVLRGPAIIGRYSELGPDAKVVAQEHPYRSLTTFVGRGFGDVSRSHMKRSAPVEIGAHVWIGGGAVVLKGVRIGTGCVVGANAVITKDIEPFSIVVGVPGKVVGKRYTETLRKALLEYGFESWGEEEFKKIADVLELEDIVMRESEVIRIIKERLS